MASKKLQEEKILKRKITEQDKKSNKVWLISPEEQAAFKAEINNRNPNVTDTARAKEHAIGSPKQTRVIRKITKAFKPHKNERRSAAVFVLGRGGCKLLPMQDMTKGTRASAPSAMICDDINSDHLEINAPNGLMAHLRTSTFSQNSIKHALQYVF